MALIDALKRQLEHAQNLLTEIDEKRAKLNADYHEQWHYVADFNTAIAALEPAPAEPEAEPEPSLFAEEDTPSDDEDLSLTEAEIDALADEDEPAEPIVEDWEPSEQIWTPGGGSYTTDLPPPADPEPTELDAEPASVLDNPELLAAVERAQQTLDAEPAAYVGLNDPELDDAWDAMKAREEAEAKPKPLLDTWHNKFGIFRTKEPA